jgi:hypothetical protein
MEKDKKDIHQNKKMEKEDNHDQKNEPKMISKGYRAASKIRPKGNNGNESIEK